MHCLARSPLCQVVDGGDHQKPVRAWVQLEPDVAEIAAPYILGNRKSSNGQNMNKGLPGVKTPVGTCISLRDASDASPA